MKRKRRQIKAFFTSFFITIIVCCFIFFSTYAISQTAASLRGEKIYSLSVSFENPLLLSINIYGRIFEIDFKGVDKAIKLFNRYPIIKTLLRF